ncbi:MAG: DUF1573 domain-containing protein [Chitinophagaceae bacterium]
MRFLLFSLFLVLTSFSKSYSQTGAERGPRFSFIETKHDFDTVSKDSALDCRFEFTNSGTENLMIMLAQPTCPCMKVDWSREPIAVGQKGWVTAHVAPGELEGRFNKGIFIQSNAVNFDPALGAYELRILGVIGEKKPTSILRKKYRKHKR